MQLAGRAALVTGASRGLGAALAVELARRGVRVVGVAREASGLEPVVARIRIAGGEAHALVADQGDRDAIYPLVGAATALVGPIDVLVLNASTLGPVPLRELADTECEDFARVLEVNLLGPFRLVKAIVGSMVVRGGGLVIALSSDAAVNGYAGWGPYGVSKAGLDHLLRTWAAELSESGVRFLSIDPGEMDTQMHADAMPEARSHERSPTQLGRVAPRAPLRVGGAAAERLEARAAAARQRGMSALAPAVWPAEDPASARLLHVDPACGTIRDGLVSDLTALLRPGDLLVLNDAGTLPGSLVGWSARGPLELRLAGPPQAELWPAVLFGAGSWRERTEDRRPPPRLDVGDRIQLEAPGPETGLAAEVVSLSALSPRLVELRFDREGAALWRALFRVGRPVQYSYLRAPLPLWHAQTAFAGRPFAAEMPSAGRPLRVSMLRALRRGGIAIATLTHAAGLSATGDPVLDAALPLPELSLIPDAAVAAVERARAEGGRVVAVGTTVVRALEGAFRDGRLRAGANRTDLRIGPGFLPRVASGLLTGLHQPGESHFELVQAFAPRPLLEAALAHARDAGYLGHEFGDSSLILASGSAAGR